MVVVIRNSEIMIALLEVLRNFEHEKNTWERVISSNLKMNEWAIMYDRSINTTEYRLYIVK